MFTILFVLQSSNLTDHIKSDHPNLWEKLITAKPIEAAFSKARQVTKAKFGHELMRRLAIMSAIDYRPVSFAETHAFMYMMDHATDHQFQSASHTHVRFFS